MIALEEDEVLAELGWSLLLQVLNPRSSTRVE